jgi:hypothetical protein
VPPLARVFELVDLPELLEDVLALLDGDAGAGIADGYGKLAAPAAMRTSPASVNLMASPTRLSNSWVRRCSSPRP